MHWIDLICTWEAMCDETALFHTGNSFVQKQQGTAIWPTIDERYPKLM